MQTVLVVVMVRRCAGVSDGEHTTHSTQIVGVVNGLQDASIDRKKRKERVTRKPDSRGAAGAPGFAHKKPCRYVLMNSEKNISREEGERASERERSRRASVTQQRGRHGLRRRYD